MLEGDWLKSRREVLKPLLLQIGLLWSKAKVSELLPQLFAPITSVYKKSCDKRSQTVSFFATLFSPIKSAKKNRGRKHHQDGRRRKKYCVHFAAGEIFLVTVYILADI